MRVKKAESELFPTWHPLLHLQQPSVTIHVQSQALSQRFSGNFSH